MRKYPVNLNGNLNFKIGPLKMVKLDIINSYTSKMIYMKSVAVFISKSECLK